MENDRFGWDAQECAKRWAHAHRPGQARRAARHTDSMRLRRTIAFALVLWLLCALVGTILGYIEHAIGKGWL
jgi:hypothetical protein